MYNHIWKKYLPIIKILIKKAASGEQVLDLNKIDFERAGTARKAGYKFMIDLSDARVMNIISGSQLAADLAHVMLEDEPTRQLLAGKHFEVSLNTKFQLTVKSID